MREHLEKDGTETEAKKKSNFVALQTIKGFFKDI